MDDNLRETVPGVPAAGLTASLGWSARTYPWRRALRRRRRFPGLPGHSACPPVAGRRPGAGGETVRRDGVPALPELSALAKECGAHAQVAFHDAVRRGVGGVTEFRVGGPVPNRRAAARLRSLLPGVRGGAGSAGPGPDQAASTVGGECRRTERGSAEHVPLARPTAGEAARPVLSARGRGDVTRAATGAPPVPAAG